MEEQLDLIEDMDFIEPSNKKEVNSFFAGYLSLCQKDISFLDLFALFEEDFFLFLSIFSGREIKIPSLKTLKDIQKRAVVYLLLQNNSAEEVSSMFDGISATRVNQIKTVVEDDLEGFNLNNLHFENSRFVKSLEKYKEESKAKKNLDKQVEAVNSDK